MYKKLLCILLLLVCVYPATAGYIGNYTFTPSGYGFGSVGGAITQAAKDNAVYVTSEAISYTPMGAETNALNCYAADGVTGPIAGCGASLSISNQVITPSGGNANTYTLTNGNKIITFNATATKALYPTAYYWYITSNNDGTGACRIWRIGGTAPADVTFDIALSGNYSQPISGATIVLSNGQTNTTASDGRARIRVSPGSNAYTYTITKTGYAGIFNADLGNLGLNGGTAYLTLAPSSNTTSPAGYTRTTVYATDASTGGKIIGATLNLRDVQNNSWVNATSTIMGTIIDVQTGHTLDIYGSYPGAFAASQELGAVAGGDYYLPLMPPVPAPPGGIGGGFVNLFVNVFDSSTNNIIQSASVTAKLPTGATTGENTGTTGTVLFLVPNNTVIVLGGSASGYASISQSTLSGTGADKIVNMKLIHQTVATPTPIVTDPGTGAVITAVPTIDARTSTQKDTDMMNLLRDNGGNIVSLAIVAILFGLLKMIMKF